ncbi:hypothetical protein [Brachybacterium hainanense]|uniref:Histidine kinase/HSP90-like ATPase domain-containing protein n=1 Tax=Brachybacterium hainanense TaxID=1541174 RepID=A0ABV6R5S1_9MICO
MPLEDELANAADLLRAAGAHVDLDVAPQVPRAPAHVLGPVIRETTTNVLRHGGGRWARLALHLDGASWRYEIVNDLPVAPAAPTLMPGSGTGLAGIDRRLQESGGALDVREEDGTFALVATVPDPAGSPR